MMGTLGFVAPNSWRTPPQRRHRRAGRDPLLPAHRGAAVRGGGQADLVGRTLSGALVLPRTWSRARSPRWRATCAPSGAPSARAGPARRSAGWAARPRSTRSPRSCAASSWPAPSPTACAGISSRSCSTSSASWSRPCAPRSARWPSPPPTRGWSPCATPCGAGSRSASRSARRDARRVRGLVGDRLAQQTTARFQPARGRDLAIAGRHPCPLSPFALASQPGPPARMGQGLRGAQ